MRYDVVMAGELIVPGIDERTRKQVVRRLGVKSLRQIAEELSIPMDTVLQIKQEVADSIDALTVDEHIAQSLSLLRDVAEKAREHFDRTEDERAKAPLLAASVTATKTFMAELHKWREKNNGAVESLNRLRVREIIEAMNLMARLTADKLDDGQPHNADEILNVMLESLKIAAEEMEVRNDSGA